MVYTLYQYRISLSDCKLECDMYLGIGLKRVLRPRPNILLSLL